MDRFTSTRYSQITGLALQCLHTKTHQVEKSLLLCASPTWTCRRPTSMSSYVLPPWCMYFLPPSPKSRFTLAIGLALFWAVATSLETCSYRSHHRHLLSWHKHRFEETRNLDKVRTSTTGLSEVPCPASTLVGNLSSIRCLFDSLVNQ